MSLSRSLFPGVEPRGSTPPTTTPEGLEGTPTVRERRPRTSWLVTEGVTLQPRVRRGPLPVVLWGPSVGFVSSFVSEKPVEGGRYRPLPDLPPFSPRTYGVVGTGVPCRTSVHGQGRSTSSNCDANRRNRRDGTQWNDYGRSQWRFDELGVRSRSLDEDPLRFGSTDLKELNKGQNPSCFTGDEHG